MKKQFIEGGENYGQVPRAVMEKFWEDLMGFADYAFNKSHSACYGLIAYQTAYLKAHYPEAFMAALMTSDYDDTDRLTIEMSECQHMGIDVLPPDINESFVEFAVVPGKKQIRFGMSAIKNVGVGAVEEILAARDDGKFKSLEDFFTRVNSRTVNRKTIESLIKTGAFDRFDSRSKLLNNIDAMISFSQKKQKEKESGQTDLFGEASEELATTSEIVIGPEDTHYTEQDYLQWERELMGLYLSDHPLGAYETILKEKTNPISEITKSQDGKKAHVGGIINTVRVIQTKKGDNMAFVGIEDMYGETELLVFPSVYEQTAWLWEQDKVVLVDGSVNAKDRDGNLSDDVKINVSTAREVILDCPLETLNSLAFPSSLKNLVRLGAITTPTQSLEIFLHRQSAFRNRNLVIHFQQEMFLVSQRNGAELAGVVVSLLNVIAEFGSHQGPLACSTLSKLYFFG